ncbi:carboxypeptidase regulatory-like domain-containing protein, partial [Asanoa sp. NPDC050611]|uniref:carboxypeptidase regulatory-like domain-containing protein n=1 Tax=Asanoa sp. NPDC050611 TaxID=3157098 RepID=UPI0033C3D1A1
MATVTTAITLTALAQAPARADDPVAISGHVSSNSSGATVTDGCVTVFQADTPVEVATGCLDADGQFTVPVTPGAYKVRIRATGFPDQWYFQSSTFARAARVDVSEFGFFISVSLFDGFADIAGRITRSDGAAVERAAVTATSVASGSQTAAMTDANGAYTIADLAPGRYTVFTHTDDLGSQWAFATKVFADAAVFDLAPGEVRVVDDTLLPLSTVEVVMVDEKDHKRITRGCVHVTDRPGGETCENANGVFTVGGVPAGDYEVRAEPEGTHWPATRTLTVAPGRTQRITVEVERATAFVTTVRESATGRPAAGVCVQFANPNLHPALFSQGCSAPDGRLVVGPLEGAVRTQIFALHPDDRYGAQWIGAKGGTGDQRRATFFTAKNDEAKAIAPIRVDPPGSVTGVARDAGTGAPLNRVCAFPFALSSTTALDRQVGPHCSDATGRFTINGLGPYAWPVLHIAVFRPQYAWLWSGGASDRFAADYVQVRSGGTTTKDIAMVPEGTITGGGSTATGEPAFVGGIIAHNTRTGDLAAPPTSSSDFETGGYVVRSLATQDVRIADFVARFEWLSKPDNLDTVATVSVVVTVVVT